MTESAECFWCGRRITWSSRIEAWGAWCEARGRKWFDRKCDRYGHEHEPLLEGGEDD